MVGHHHDYDGWLWGRDSRDDVWQGSDCIAGSTWNRVDCASRRYPGQRVCRGIAALKSDRNRPMSALRPADERGSATRLTQGQEGQRVGRVAHMGRLNRQRAPLVFGLIALTLLLLLGCTRVDEVTPPPFPTPTPTPDIDYRQCEVGLRLNPGEGCFYNDQGWAGFHSCSATGWHRSPGRRYRPYVGVQRESGTRREALPMRPAYGAARAKPRRYCAALPNDDKAI